VVHGTNVAQATLRIGSPLAGSPSPAGASPVSSALHSAPTVPRLVGIPLEERSRREYRGLGFTSVVRHLSLRGWLRWIQSNQCDATLRVRTRDGGSGCIWCSAGKVVDAEWNTLAAVPSGAATFAGEPALMELLRLESGSVSIDFDPVDRPRRIARMTLPLEESPLEESPLDGPALEQPPLEAGLVLPEATRPEPSAVALREPPRARRILRTEYFAGGILLAAFALLAFAFGRQRATSDDALVIESRRTQETQALLPPPSAQKAPPSVPSAAPEPKDLSLIRFATLEVEPARAEIWLDHSLLGLGHVELAPLLDGELHELRFVAAGRAPRSLYFMGSPPSGRVVLEQAEPGAGEAAAPGEPLEPELRERPAPEPALQQRNEDEHVEALPRAEPAPRAVRAAARRRPAPVAAASSSASPPARAESAASAKTSPAKKAPQIQLIEARTPRVQVLE
jgi:hypothetical protein